MATTLTPYLSFPGTTREAYAFYAQTLGATIEAMMSYDDIPAPPAGAATKTATTTDSDPGCYSSGSPPTGDSIMHACLKLPGGAMLFAGDVPPGMPFDGIKGVMIAVQYDTVDEAHRAFAALSQDGQVTMPLAPAFWAETFGMLTDRFGVSWAINGAPIPVQG